MFRSVLVALDGSSHAEAAPAEAIEVVQAGRGRLTIITVVPEPSLLGSSCAYWAPVDFGVLGHEVESPSFPSGAAPARLRRDVGGTSETTVPSPRSRCGGRRRAVSWPTTSAGRLDTASRTTSWHRDPPTARRRLTHRRFISCRVTVDVVKRWEDHGAVWRARSVTATEAIVDLCSCTGEPVDRLRSDEPALLRYLADRPRFDAD